MVSSTSLHPTRLFLLLLIYYHASTTVTAFSSTVHATAPTEHSNNIHRRVFVGGLQTLDQEKLKVALEARHGPVESVFVMRAAWSQPYAFVEFVEASDAERAIGTSTVTEDVTDNGGKLLYQEIKAVKIVTDPQNKRTKSNTRKDKTQHEYDNKRQIAQQSTLLLQLQKSHLDRVQEFLQDNGYATTTGSYTSSSLAMLGVQTKDDTSKKLREFLATLEPAIPIFQCAIRKLYSVDPKFMVEVGEEKEEQQQRGFDRCATLLQETPPEAKVRLDVFPPKLAPKIIAHLTENHPELLNDKLSPTDYSHRLSVVQIPTKESSFWCLGIMEEEEDVKSSNSQVATSSNNQKNTDRSICRAQAKLHEALARYQHDSLPTPSINNGLIAVDCGSAPGGWTNFLADKDNPYVQCQTIYSIDPGDLDPTIQANSKVVHLQLKVEDAMKVLLKEIKVDLWVSDMCLHQMSEQVDMMLQAKRDGIVGTGTFFVLTLKCVTGHSRRSFDWQVAQQCDRLEEHCRTGSLETIHLFSNRSGERTILGYLN